MIKVVYTPEHDKYVICINEANGSKQSIVFTLKEIMVLAAEIYIAVGKGKDENKANKISDAL